MTCERLFAVRESTTVSAPNGFRHRLLQRETA